MTTASVRMTVEWHVPVPQARSMSMALHAVAADIRSSPGCLRCAICTDLEQAGIIRYVEDWASEHDLRRRMLADNFAPLARLIEDVSRPPRIEFTLASGYRRGDYLYEVRNGTAKAG